MRLSQRLPNYTLAGLLVLCAIATWQGCRNPASSTLPPSAINHQPVNLPPLPKGDVYADESVPPADMPIDIGDTVDVVVRRGTGEEKFSGTVKENGEVGVSFLDVDVRGLTVAQAEERIQEQLKAYVKQPRVQITLKKKSLKVKRVFVFGDVKRPGQVPMFRNMTVLHVVGTSDAKSDLNYNETALLEEIRVVRGGDLSRPQILMADLARLFTYGDFSRNVLLEENDIVFVPREHLGDAAEASRKLIPILQTAVTPLYPAFLVPAFFPGAVVR